MTGTGSLSVPVAVSPARSGFSPQLSVSYDSGSGNGVFGIGWNLSLPAISRKTDKGLPQYRDYEESDVFILSGSEDLVPSLRLDDDSEWGSEKQERDGFCIQFYRPRIEGLFARIERWTRKSDGDIHWRSFTKDNVITIYGDSPESRINDPDLPVHIFKWLIASSTDQKGNAIVYEYSAEDSRGVDQAQLGRHPRAQDANRYLKRILYGNRKPWRCGSSEKEQAGWMFEVVFDFGDEGYREFRSSDNEERVRLVAGAEDASRPVRKDPFSTYRSGFEIRTNRLCRRTLMFHHFPQELGVSRYLVRSTEFRYNEKAISSFLTEVVQSGYTRLGDDSYRKKSLPPLDLAYTPSPLEDEFPRPFELLEAESQNLPMGIDGENYRWIDLNGEGISGVLSEQGSGWYYKRNLGRGRFGVTQLVARKPVSGPLNSPYRLLDVGGKGQLDLVELASGSAGFYERIPDPADAGGLNSGWGRFRAFQALPVVNWSDPNLRFVDVTGDGIADILITEDVAFSWHPSLQAAGFGSAIRIPAPSDEDLGPRVVFSEPDQSIYLADMSGDGLTDIVRIRNGEVCYWPNLGYGRFGAKILMAHSPWFDQPGLFDNRRIRLADTDGSGTIDILYIAADEIHVYLNESGNSLSPRKILCGLPAADTNFISVVDFLGRGTACLVWSSSLPQDAGRPLRYVDLMRGKKPHLLTRISNNLGAETVVDYASSTEFYLADKAAGHPWMTPLPFPVHVVKRVESFDYISKTRFVSTASYHHGYYDGIEREFRGFGRVDQLDSEEFGGAPTGAFPVAVNQEQAWSVPPVLTKTWFHLGLFLGVGQVSRQMAHEYYREPGEGPNMRLDDTILPTGLNPEEAREACRALSRSMLRREVYALDGSKESDRPYVVAESNSAIRLLQPRASNLHCVFFAHARESLTLNYERKLYKAGHALRADPRVAHSITLAVDDYGNVLQSLSAAYGRRLEDQSELLTDSDRAQQGKLLATLTENNYTNAINEPAAYHTPGLAESCVYELVHLESIRRDSDRTGLLRFNELRHLVARAGDGRHDLPFEDVKADGATGPGPYRRLIQAARTLYRSDSLDRLLPLGNLDPLALPGEKYSLALTPGLIAQVYQSRLPQPHPILGADGGYVDLDGDGRWWVPSGFIFYSANATDDTALELEHARRHFYMPRRFKDPFGNILLVTYDPHDLMPVETRDAGGNVMQAQLDYRVLQLRRVSDANGNRSEAAFDALGMLVGTAVMGKAGEQVGDSLDGFVADLPEQVVLEHLQNPLANPSEILVGATTRVVYDIFSFNRTRHKPRPQPCVTYSLARETHVSDLAPGEQTKIQHTFAYSDGFGREVQKKLQAEPGPIPGQEMANIDPRWVGSGWTIFNNKEKPVRRYEPFFSATHHFEFASMVGVTATLIYDPVGRVVATLNPNHSFQKTVFDPWRQETWDANDTTLINPRRDPDVGAFFGSIPLEEYSPTWYEQRHSGELGRAEQEAAWKTAAHASTPAIAFADPLGRAFLSVPHNRFRRDDAVVDEFYATRLALDIQGNQRSVTDALGRVIMDYDYDVAGRKIHSNSADAGQRWIVSDIGGKPIQAFDSRDHRLRYEYDQLRRPIALFVRTDNRPEKLAERTEYGESQSDPEAQNLRGKLYRQCDEAGVVTDPAYDFKGNLVRSTRQMLVNYRDEVDWASSPQLDTEVFSTETSYDALNRPVSLTAPDRSVVRPAYNEANLLERLDVSLKAQATFTPFVTNIDYNAKGQRELIEYGNGARTSNAYDPLTFRLANLKTTRANDTSDLQALTYTYDSVGNISSIADAAQQTVYFKNEVVKASGSYVYDAVYRLIQAKGREHAGNPDQPETSYNDVPRVRLPLPTDGRAMHNYRELYQYDAVGNILEVLHSAAGNGNWRRRYEYGDINANNRLTKTSVGNTKDHYSYDPNGNVISMQHLPAMTWNFKDQLRSAQTQVVKNGGQAGTAYYVYDSGGQRARKTDDSGKRRADRIYLGGFEIYREYGAHDSVTLERTTLHVMDNERRVALVESHGEETTVRYQFDNHLGSSCLELDASGWVISYEEYYAYGSTSYQAGRSVSEVSLKRYRFTGNERDEATGFSYHGARYYAPWLGRWLSCDPKGLKDAPSLYTYCQGNPVTRTDKNGMDSDSDYEWCVLCNPFSSNVEVAPIQAVKALASNALEGSRIITSGISRGTTAAADWVFEQYDDVAHSLEESGHPWLAGFVRGQGVILATGVKTVTEVGGQLIAIGPNMVLTLHAGGENIGTGAGMVATADDWKDTTLGILHILAGVGEGAQVALQATGMAKSWGSGTIEKVGPSPTVQENRLHGLGFEETTVEARSTPWRESETQVTIRPNVGPGTPGTKADNFIIDTLEQSKMTQEFQLVESKGTATADLTRNQRAGFPNFERWGGEVRGAGGCTLAPAGTQLPPSVIKIVRPLGLFIEKVLPPSLLNIVRQESPH